MHCTLQYIVFVLKELNFAYMLSVSTGVISKFTKKQQHVEKTVTVLSV